MAEPADDLDLIDALWGTAFGTLPGFPAAGTRPGLAPPATGSAPMPDEDPAGRGPSESGVHPVARRVAPPEADVSVSFASTGHALRARHLPVEQQQDEFVAGLLDEHEEALRERSRRAGTLASALRRLAAAIARG